MAKQPMGKCDFHVALAGHFRCYLAPGFLDGDVKILLRLVCYHVSGHRLQTRELKILLWFADMLLQLRALAFMSDEMKRGSGLPHGVSLEHVFKGDERSLFLGQLLAP